MMEVTVVAILVVLLLVIVLVVISTIRRKGRWGINSTVKNCPNCGLTVPAIRKPATLQQTLWGGSTCLNCGTEIDKWGKEISRKTK